jgi:hypothetical protein
MNRTRRMGHLGGLAAAAVAATPFAWLWVLTMRNADDPLTTQARLDMAIWMAVFGTPWMLAAWLLWRAWWRQACAQLSTLDGPGWLLAVAAATLPAERRDWGAAMAAELAQVQDRWSRWRFAAGCARAAVFPPRGGQMAVLVTGALAVAALAATGLATGAALPAGRVFALTFVALVGGLAMLTVARWGRVGRAGAGDRRPGAGGHRRLPRVHHLLPGRVSLLSPGPPAHDLGEPPAGDGGGPGGGAGRLPAAGVAAAALAAR